MPDTLPDAVAIGSCDAADAFGLSKTAWARLLGAGLGAAAATGVSERDERPQSAVMGGLLGYMGGSALSGVKQVPAAAGRFGRWAWNKAPGIVAAMPKFGSDFSVGVGVPGTPLTLQNNARDERLPGMHRWVPRDLIERTHRALDVGLEPSDVLDMEEQRGSLTHPLVGAGAGAALARYGLNAKSLTGTGLGALLGGGAGAAYNKFTAPIRRQDASEALHGVQHERSKFPLRGQQAVTANAATPMVVSNAHGAT